MNAAITRKPDSATITVVSVPENAVPEFSDMKEFAAWVKSMLAEGGNVLIRSTGQEARFSSGNVKASVKRSRSNEHRNAYAGLREMVENAEYDRYEAPDERHPGSGGQDVYYSALVMGGKLYSVKLKLDVVTEEQKASERGKGIYAGEDVRYKDHKLVEIEIAPAQDRGFIQMDKAAHGADAISEVSLGVLRGSVKPSVIDEGILSHSAWHGFVRSSLQIRDVFDSLSFQEIHHSKSKEAVMTKDQDFYKEVAEKLIDQLQKGTAPWQRPWEGGEGAYPYNPTTGQQYHGGNVLNLLMQGYADPRWMTFRQATEMGAQVRKGEHGTRIIYWRFEGKQPVLDEEGAPRLDADGKPLKEEVRLERPRPFISYVFNAEQIEGLPPLEQETPKHSWNPVEKAEELLAKSGARIKHLSQSKAYYTPLTDTITLPLKEQFAEQEGYYATALHELGHWTGHESRLARDICHPFGSEAYAKEELRAEIASMMLSMEIGLPNVNIENHAAYVQSWIKVLREDPKEIFRASADAGKILEYVMGLEREQKQQQGKEKEQMQERQPEIKDSMPVPERREPSMAKRVYLDVPYQEKEQAKQLGAGWDRQRKQWYVPSGRSVDAFAAWLPKAQQAELSSSQPQTESRKHNGVADSNRVYLTVPYGERREAKQAGALWDSIVGSWYAGPKADMEKLDRWLPGNLPEQMPALDPREEFAEAMRSMNFIVEGEHPVMDGKAHRIQTADDKPGQKTGFYIGYLDGRPAGYIKDNRTGEELRWKCSGPMPSRENREKFQAACQARKQEHAAVLQEQYRKAAERVQTQLGYMQAASDPLPYHTAKGIAVHPGGMVGKEGTLCLPAHDVDGKTWTMQYINADGTKRFARESRKEGCFHPVGGMSAVRSASALVICEGYATACSVAESLGMATIAAFDSGNLVSVAKALHEKFPNKPIIIAGDDDRAIKVNAGRIHAEQAAKEVGGVSVFPVFAPTETGKDFTDFNDLAVKSSLGKDAVKRQVEPVVRQAVQAKQAELALLRQQSQSQSLGRSL